MAFDGYAGLPIMWGHEVHFQWGGGANPIRGGEASGSFSYLGAAYSLQCVT